MTNICVRAFGSIPTYFYPAYFIPILAFENEFRMRINVYVAIEVYVLYPHTNVCNHSRTMRSAATFSTLLEQMSLRSEVDGVRSA